MSAFVRRLELWNLLAASPEPMRLRELALRFGVSKQTIQRDLDALSLAGVPVTEQQEGQAGLFSIPVRPPGAPRR